MVKRKSYKSFFAIFVFFTPLLTFIAGIIIFLFFRFQVRNSQEYFRKGKIAFEVGDYYLAEAAYLRSVEYNKRDDQAWNELGNTYLNLYQQSKKSENLIAAIDSYYNSLRINNHQSFPHIKLAQSFIIDNNGSDFDKAKNEYKRALRYLSNLKQAQNISHLITIIDRINELVLMQKSVSIEIGNLTRQINVLIEEIKNTSAKITEMKSTIVNNRSLLPEWKKAVDYYTQEEQQKENDLANAWFWQKPKIQEEVDKIDSELGSAQNQVDSIQDNTICLQKSLANDNQVLIQFRQDLKKFKIQIEQKRQSLDKFFREKKLLQTNF